MKVLMIIMSSAGLLSCGANNQKNSDLSNELTAKQIADSVSYLMPDSNQATADKGFSIDLEGPVESDNLSIVLWRPGKFKIDPDLNYYLPVNLTNKSNFPVIGISLRRGRSGEYVELGKFKIKLRPHGSAILRLSLQALKLDKSILSKVWTIGPIAANEVYYSDGTYSSETVTYTVEPSVR